MPPNGIPEMPRNGIPEVQQNEPAWAQRDESSQAQQNENSEMQREFSQRQEDETVRVQQEAQVEGVKEEEQVRGACQQEEPSRSRNRIYQQYFSWMSHISVEPTMWLYMMAFMFTSVVEQAFFVYKACRVDHGHSDEICSKLNDNQTIKAEVQKTVSDFHMWNNIAGHVVPIILALFFGNWSDRRGRKLPLIFGLLGKLIYSFMVTINTIMSNWNLNMVVFTASLPMGMLGADVAIFGCCFAYISDICSVQQRTLRITILDIVYLSTMPLGIALGSYVFDQLTKLWHPVLAYTIMFAINANLLVIAIIYSFICLKWQTSSQQQSFTGVNLLTDFFDKQHVVKTIQTLTKSRLNNGKLHLFLLLLAMCLYTFQRDEKPMSFLYTQLMFKWDVASFSRFRTFQSILFVLAMLIGVPMMSKYLNMRDTSIVAIGAIAHAAGRVLFATGKNPQLFYVGAVAAALGPVVAPVLRSMISKIVPTDERGKTFAMLSVCDNAVPLFSGVLYSQLYNATITTQPSAIYWLTFATQISVLLLILLVNFTSKQPHDTEEDINREDTSFPEVDNSADISSTATA